MKKKLEELKDASLAAISSAESIEALESLRIKYLGKKGELTAVLKLMGGLSDNDRPIIGQLANKIRADLEAGLDMRRELLAKKLLELRLKAETIDVTIPGNSLTVGKKHPLTTVLDEAKEIFVGMGFTIAEGPEVEYSDYNFTKLNTSEGHPARDRQDTFYFTDDDSILLRTQTSPVQVRVMEHTAPPIRIISPGRVYRKDEVDATHSPMFHQIEGLVVDKGITMGDLKGTLNTLVERLYGVGAKTRFRPHHFPFTEPSCEVDVQCFECGGKGCRVCKGTGWIEILGCGVTNPHEIANCGYDPKVWTGLAFGLGVDRMANLKFGINDIRLEYENDARFLRQF